MSELIVPGKWKCDQCGFVLIKRVLAMAQGIVGTDYNPEADICPNDGLYAIPSADPRPERRVAQRRKRSVLQLTDRRDPDTQRRRKPTERTGERDGKNHVEVTQAGAQSEVSSVSSPVQESARATSASAGQQVQGENGVRADPVTTERAAQQESETVRPGASEFTGDLPPSSDALTPVDAAHICLWCRKESGHFEWCENRAAQQGGQNDTTTTSPSNEGHAAGPAVAARPQDEQPGADDIGLYRAASPQEAAPNSSLEAAIQGDYNAMSKDDLVRTVAMLHRGRAAWRLRAEKAEAAAPREAQAVAASVLSRHLREMEQRCGLVPYDRGQLRYAADFIDAHTGMAATTIPR